MLGVGGRCWIGFINGGLSKVWELLVWYFLVVCENMCLGFLEIRVVKGVVRVIMFLMLLRNVVLDDVFKY